MKGRPPGLLILLILLTGMVFAVQIKNITKAGILPLVPLNEFTKYQRELDQLRLEKAEKMEELLQLENELNAIGKQQFEKDDYLKDLATALNFYQAASGRNDARGPGITITIRKSDRALLEADPDNAVISQVVLLNIINKLKESGAEAISINEQRIVNTTGIYLAEGAGIRINGTIQTMPFTIKSIGNPERMEATLRLAGGIYDNLTKQKQLKVSIVQSQNIEIGSYTGSITFQNARPVSEPEVR